jgi:hypothetical protein
MRLVMRRATPAPAADFVAVLLADEVLVVGILSAAIVMFRKCCSCVTSVTSRGQSSEISDTEPSISDECSPTIATMRIHKAKPLATDRPVASPRNRHNHALLVPNKGNGFRFALVRQRKPMGTRRELAKSTPPKDWSWRPRCPRWGRPCGLDFDWALR